MGSGGDRPEGEAIDRGAFLNAMSLLPGPVAIITTGGEEQRNGLTVSAICSLSADPPSIVVCVNKSASAHDSIIANGCFGVSVLRSGQEEIATLFTKKNVDRFATAEWTTLSTGSPVLTSCLVSLDCRLVEAMDGFSHTILKGTVVDMIHSGQEPSACLLWHQRRYGAASGGLETSP